MEKVSSYIFKLIKNALYNTKESYEGINENWDEVYKALAINGLLALTYNAMLNVDEELKPDEQLQKAWKANSFSVGFNQIIKNNDILKLLSDAKEQNIELIVFKGLALSKLYPNMQDRSSCDSDLLVGYDQLEQAKQFIFEHGYEFNKVHSKEHVSNFYKNNGAAIELHTQLWEDFEGKLIDVLKELDLANKHTLIKETVGNVEITTLGYTQHLIFQIFHIAKHFALEGIGLKYILDLSLFVNAYIDKMDLNYFWNSMEKLGYTQFAICLFNICKQHLMIDEAIIPTEYHDCEFDNDIIDDFINIGKTGEKDKYHWAASKVLEPIFLGEELNMDTKKESIRYAIFPSVEYLNSMFPFSKGRNYLIPIVWIMRCFKIVHRAFTKKNVKSNIDYKIEKADKRIEMMKKTGLIK